MCYQRRQTNGVQEVGRSNRPAPTTFPSIQSSPILVFPCLITNGFPLDSLIAYALISARSSRMPRTEGVLPLFKELQHRFLGVPRPVLKPPAALPPANLNELVRVDIVGEASYQQELRYLVPGDRTEDSVSVWKIASLVPEPENKFDANAVVVLIEGFTVGYLDRRQGVLYHAMMAEAGMPGESIEDVDAEIRGGWRRDGISANYGVALYMPPAVASKLTPARRSRRQPARREL